MKAYQHIRPAFRGTLVACLRGGAGAFMIVVATARRSFPQDDDPVGLRSCERFSWSGTAEALTFPEDYLSVIPSR